MLKTVFQQLDRWIESENEHRRNGGGALFPKTVIKVLGQSALFEAKVDLHLAATMDVDAYTEAEWVITKKFDELLRKHGRHWDAHSSEIWMPHETQYAPLFSGQHVEASLAEPDYVLLSKALKAPIKNRNLITDYLAKGASDRFLELAGRYHLDLEQFV